MTPFASRPRFDAPAAAPHRILVRRILVFALLLLLTSGLRGVPDKLESALTRALGRLVEIQTTGDPTATQVQLPLPEARYVDVPIDDAREQ